MTDDRFQVQVDDEGRTYIDMTPTWREILPTWLFMLREAYRGNVTDPDLTASEARKELERMADAADKWNAHCKLVEQLNASNDCEATAGNADGEES